MNLRYRVELSQSERAEFMRLLSGGTRAARKLKRAQVLLGADSRAGDEEPRGALGSASRPSTGQSAASCSAAWSAALSEEPRRGAERMFSGKEKVLLVASALDADPGRTRWMLELLAHA